MTGSELSELSVRRLLARRRRLAAGLSEPERTLRGVLHGPYSYLAIYSEGRGRTVYVPAAVEAACEAHVQVTRRNDALLAEVSQINLELLRRRALE